MNQRQKIVELARSLVGVPYRHMGRDATGIDCLGVAIWIAEELGLPVPEVGDYSRVPSGRRMMLGFREHAIPIRLSEAEPGDFIHLAYSRQPQHVAILTGVDPWRVVHADSIVGRVTEHSLSNGWLARIRGTYRFPEAPGWQN